MAVIEVTGVAFLNAIAGQVIQVGSDYLVEEFKWCCSIKSELRRLKNIDLPRVVAVVEAAEKGDIELTDSLNEWLWSLKDVLYEADDVLDDLKYLELQKQAEEGIYGAKEMETMHEQHRPQLQGCCSQLRIPAFMKSSFSQFKKATNLCCCQQQTCCHIPQLDLKLKKLREVIHDLRQVADATDLANFYNLVKDAEKQQQREEGETTKDARATTAMLTDRPVLGRDEEKSEIIQWLMQSEDNLQFLSIVGHGGVGKTALAQFVLEDERVEASFSPIMWACVSPSFDLERIMKEMLVSTEAKKPEFDTFNGLQTTLKSLLKSAGKKFLLVLDDAWDEQNHDLWGKLLAPLNFARNGGRILLTTRLESVGRTVEQALTGVSGAIQSPMKVMTLSGLYEREYLELFNRHAFSGEDPKSYPCLQLIGGQIASKLGGLPLLAKVVGSMLNKKLGDTRYWRRFRDDTIPCNILSNLKLSYDHLAPHLKPCFAYCSIFRQERMFRKEDVVRMWIAVGLVRQDSSEESMEEKGSHYFEDLLDCSFFEQIEGSYYDYYGSHHYDRCYSMHDLLFELAQLVSRDECFCFTDDMLVQEIPSRIRHLHFSISNLDTIFKIEKAKWRNLRTLFIYVHGFFHEHELGAILNEVFESLKSIRVLVLYVNATEVLPDAIGALRHLRYLDFRRTVPRWPQTLSKLHNLQFLKCNVDSAQPDIQGLISLRHSDFAASSGVGKLTFLQELKFDVRRETGLRIRELKNLTQLRELSINYLENVMSHEEASEARIHGKKHLRELTLTWFTNVGSNELELLHQNNGYDPKWHEEVLKCLKPNSSLEKLAIENYMGVQCLWMDPRLLRNIEAIELRSCLRWAQLSPLGKLNSLTSLHLENMPGVRRISPRDGFKALQFITIQSLEQWEQWYADESEAETGPWCPHLHKIVIEWCPELIALPPLPLCLDELDVRLVGLTAFPKLWLDEDNGSGISRSSLSSSSSSPSLLRKLYMYGCPRLVSLTGGLLEQQRHLRALRSLTISNCKELMCLPVGGFRHLCSLQILTLSYCPKLQQLPDPEQQDATADVCYFLPASLRELHISNCGEMERTLGTLLNGAVSLIDLHLSMCNNMTSLPPTGAMATLTSLKNLNIWYCNQLASFEGLESLQLSCLSIDASDELLRQPTTTAPLFGRHYSTLTVHRLRVGMPWLLHIEPLRSLDSVQHLEVLFCSGIQSLDEVEAWLLRNRASLRSLTLYGAAALPDCILSFSSLEYLWLVDPDELQSLPRLPLSLKKLRIDRCNQVLLERLQKDGGGDWPKIQHIPCVDIVD